jgi:hypothetical protein
MIILKKYLKVKYCLVKRESHLQIANGTYNPHKLPKRGQNMHKQAIIIVFQAIHKSLTGKSPRNILKGHWPSTYVSILSDHSEQFLCTDRQTEGHYKVIF